MSRALWLLGFPSLRIGLMLIGALLLSACPSELSVPDASGEFCVQHADCNPPEDTCGVLHACVLERCSADATLLVPCDDAGILIDASVADAP